MLHFCRKFSSDVTVWSHLDLSGSFSNPTLLKSQYSCDIPFSGSSISSVLILIFSFSFLYASSSKLMNSIFLSSPISSSSTSSSLLSFLGSFDIYIYFYTIGDTSVDWLKSSSSWWIGYVFVISHILEIDHGCQDLLPIIGLVLGDHQ